MAATASCSGCSGGYTLQTRNTDSWEGWYWGAKHVWGCENLGQMVPVTNVMWDVSKNTDGILFWGCDPETTPWGFNGQLASRLSYWFTEIGIKSIYVAPDLNYGAAVHADKWIPVLPNTDAALYLAIAHVWLTEGTYDEEYVKSHTVGFDKFRDYVLGKEDGIPKTPKWAAPHHRCALLHDQGPGPVLGQEDGLHRHRQRRPGDQRPLCHRAGQTAGPAPGDAGRGQARRAPVQDDRVGPLQQEVQHPPARRQSTSRLCLAPTAGGSTPIPRRSSSPRT